MKRSMPLGFLLLLASPLFCSAGEAPGLPPNKELNEEVTVHKGTPWLGFVDTYYGYMTEIPVTLKAGNKVTINGSVTGTGRKIAIALLDPAGQMIAATKRDTHVSSTKLVVAEVGATGKYHILIVSDQIGAFKLRADYPAAGDGSKQKNGTNPQGEPKSLVPNEKLEWELVKEGHTPWIGYVDSYYGFITEIPVMLKAGNKITIDGTVRGANRRIAMALIDPAGTMIAATKRNTHVGSAKLVVDEANAGGKYHIRIVSNQIGAFTVSAKFPKVEGETKIEDKVARLRKELAEAEAKQKELQGKKDE